MKTQIVSKNKVSQCILNRAQRVLDSGNRPKYLKSGDMYKLDVGLDYRLVSKDKIKWVLMTHEKYNGYIYNRK